MKKNILYIIAVVLLTNCNKDAYLRLPKVETISAEISDKEIILTGKIIDDGNSGIYALGFCYAQDTAPKSIVQNQTLVNEMYEDGTFYTTIKNIEQNSIYYFKAFIITKTGIAEGGVIECTVSRFKAPEAPCESSLIENQVTEEVVNFDNPPRIYTANPWASYNSYEYTVTAAYGLWQPEITIAFLKQPPITGIYTTTTEINPFDGKPNDVVVRINSGGQRYRVDSGLPVYINREKDDTIIISFCDLTYGVGKVVFSLSGKMVVEQ
ncbi:MAG: hypothetical protein FWC39_10010 [Bacteroidetes bacterium]|nr:hypothetical protein [Bacteroidota bacterium]